MGEERCFRAHFPVAGERCRQRIYDDRRHHCARSSTQRRRAKKGGDQAIGRSRGGLTTKIHALVDALGNPANLMLTAGQVHDLACAQDLIENADPEALIGDKAYDADPLIDTLARREITPVIPPKTNRKIKRECDFLLYRERRLVETRLPSLRSGLTLWQIIDGSSAEFVARFFAKVKEGVPFAVALAATKREFIRGDAGEQGEI